MRLIASNCTRQSGVLVINFQLVHTDIGGGGRAIAVLTNIIDSADAWMKFTGWLLSGIEELTIFAALFYSCS